MTLYSFQRVIQKLLHKYQKLKKVEFHIVLKHLFKLKSFLNFLKFLV